MKGLNYFLPESWFLIRISILGKSEILTNASVYLWTKIAIFMKSSTKIRFVKPEFRVFSQKLPVVFVTADNITVIRKSEGKKKIVNLPYRLYYKYI